MKRLLAICLGLVILLAACGNKVDGTYSNKDVSVTANSDSGNVTIKLKALKSSGLFSEDSHDGEFNGTIDKDDNTMNFKYENQKIKLNYEVKGDKLIIEDPTGNTKEKLELTKE